MKLPDQMEGSLLIIALHLHHGIHPENIRHR